MTSYVEVNPGDAVAAANRLLRTSSDLQNSAPPPDPDSVGWGDDEFGQWMRDEYLKNVDDGPCLPDKCVEEQQSIGGRCCELSEGIHQAMHGFELQEAVNTHQMATSFDDSEDSQSGGGTEGGSAPQPTTPPSNPVSTNQESPGDSPTAAGPSTAGGPVTTGASSTSEPKTIRMVREIRLPHEQEPSPDEAEPEPERRAFMTRLLRYPDYSDEPVPEGSEEPPPETETAEDSHTAEDPGTAEDSEDSDTAEDSETEHSRTYRSRWRIESTEDTTSDVHSDPDPGTERGRIYRSRWMVQPATDGRPTSADDSSPPE